MSIEIMFRLGCDECRRPFGEFPEGATDLLMQRQLWELRSRAAKSGWARFRKRATEPMGDYCGRCAEAIRHNKKPRANKAGGVGTG